MRHPDNLFAEALRATRFYLGWADEDFARDLADTLAPKLPADASPGWARVAIRHACLRELSRRKRLEPLDAGDCATRLDVDRVLDVECAMRGLSAGTLGVLYLRLCGHDFGEISARTGYALDAARQRVSEATRQLRRRLCQQSKFGTQT